MAETILRRLRYPNRVIEQVSLLIARHMDWPAIPSMRSSKQRRWLLRDDYDQHAELHRLDCSACHADLSIHAWAGAEREKLLAEPPPTRPLISGHELKALGFFPGPSFGRILDALIDAQLEERVQIPLHAGNDQTHGLTPEEHVFGCDDPDFKTAGCHRFLKSPSLSILRRGRSGFLPAASSPPAIRPASAPAAEYRLQSF